MKRDSFNCESRIVGEDFGGLIDREGGKSAGLHLLRRGIDYLRKKGKLDTPRPIGTSEWYTMPTSVYTQIESILLADFYEKLIQRVNDRAIASMLYHKGLAKIICEVTGQAAKVFPGACRDSSQGLKASMPKFHLRSSTTLCDFRDDRYFGTFWTKCGEPFFAGDDCYCEYPTEGRCDILELAIDFFIKKHFAKDIFGIGDNEKLGLVLMPTQGEYGALDVISYSTYPEDSTAPTLLETWARRSLEGRVPVELIRARGNRDFERIKMSLCRDDETTRSLSNDEVETIYTLTNAFSEELGYAVNFELTLTDGVIPLQIRPVPTLDPKREVKELSQVPDDMQVIAKTPFVVGSYRRTARLVRPDYKNNYLGHAFKEPVIVWHTNDFKGHRFYDNDLNCIGVLNPEEGAVLTHDSSLVPGFGEGRERFAFIGLPIPGFRKKLEGVLQEEREKTSKGENELFLYTPFPITIESDGRKGRILVEKKNAKYFS